MTSDSGRSNSRRRLLEEGWEERFSATSSRIEEMVSLYRSLGFDVRVEDATGRLPAGHRVDSCCSGCLEGLPAGTWRTLFTRPQIRPGTLPEEPEEDLFE